MLSLSSVHSNIRSPVPCIILCYTHFTLLIQSISYNHITEYTLKDHSNLPVPCITLPLKELHYMEIMFHIWLTLDTVVLGGSLLIPTKLHCLSQFTNHNYYVTYYFPLLMLFSCFPTTLFMPALTSAFLYISPFPSSNFLPIQTSSRDPYPCQFQVSKPV